MIRPNRAMAKITGVRPLALFDPERARAIYPMAYEQGARWGEQIATSPTPRRRVVLPEHDPAA
jgi:hypothetical protein